MFIGEGNKMALKLYKVNFKSDIFKRSALHIFFIVAENKEAAENLAFDIEDDYIENGISGTETYAYAKLIKINLKILNKMINKEITEYKGLNVYVNE